jgi:hypothetical protein
MTLRFYMHQPDTIFEARVNEPSTVTYPIQDIAFDGVTTGAFGDIEPGMTVLFGSSAGADDYGRNRVRKAATSTLLKIGRSSIGTRDGEVQVVDNAYITVLDEYKIWSKIPYIDGDDNAAMYKDGDIEVGTNTTTPPPVANTGPPAAGTIDSGTSELAVSLPPGGVNQSFAVADGATISTYLWELPTGVAFTFGSVASDGAIQVAADPGFHWIKLTVTDSNGKTHTAASDDTIGASQIKEHRITRHGQTMSIGVTQDIAETTYKDGSLVLVMDGEPESQAVRRNIMFWGWGQIDPAQILASKEATLSETIIKCVDVGGRLDTLPGFTQAVYNDAKRITEANASITWAYMTNPHWDKLLHYILHWHSTALELTDWQNTGVGTTFPFTVREAGGSSLFDQMNTQCESLCPPHYFTCDRQGALNCPADPMLQEIGDRTATVQANIPVSNWSKIKYTHQRPPKTHWLDDEAVLASADVVNAVFSHAPGDAPGQGEMFNTHGEQIVVSQAILNKVCGHRYARMNAPESLFTVNLTQDQDTLIEPALMEWTTLTISAAVAAERGLTFTTARGLVSEMSIQYKHDKEAITRSLTFLWERETVGLPGVTVPPPEIPAADPYEPIPPADWTPPDLDDGAYGGSPTGFIMWDKELVYRTYDLDASSPTWEIITDVTSDLDVANVRIFDIQSTHDAAATVGAYMLTDVGLYRTSDIMAGTVSWTCVLSNATVQATEEQPVEVNPSATAVSVIASFTTWGKTPGFVVLSTSLDKQDFAYTTNYKRCYFWHSHDYGQTWTTVDAGGDHIYSSFADGDGYRSYALANLFSMAMYRDTAGTIYCARSSIKVILQQYGTVFKSTDQGHTWSIVASLDPGLDFDNNPFNVSASHPYPSGTSTMLFTEGGAGVSARTNLWKSNDEFATKTKIVDRNVFPVGYGGVPYGFRPNQNPFDDDHIITLMHYTTGGSPYNAHMMETTNGGTSWSRLGTRAFTNGNRFMPSVTFAASNYSSPNGWPGNDQWWCCVRNVNTATAEAIIVTTDNWSTDSDKAGNLNTLLGGNNWNQNGYSGGFALPKVGPNA